MVSYVILLNAIFKSPSLALLEWGGGVTFRSNQNFPSWRAKEKNIYIPHSSLIFCIRTEFEFSEYFIHNVFSYGGLQA